MSDTTTVSQEAADIIETCSAEMQRALVRHGLANMTDAERRRAIREALSPDERDDLARDIRNGDA